MAGSILMIFCGELMMGSENLNTKLDQIAFMKYSDFLKTVFNAYIMIS